MFAQKFYSYHDYNTLDEYLVLACDGTKMDPPPTPEMVEKYGGYLNQYITDTKQIKTAGELLGIGRRLESCGS